MSEPLVVVTGRPDDEELAALMTALAIVTARRRHKRPTVVPSRWRFELRQGPLPRGAGAWRAAVR